MKAEIRVTLLQAKEHQTSRKPTDAGRRAWSGFSDVASGETNAADALILDV